MPIPKPNASEKYNDYMQRCMLDDKMISEYSQEQRAAICADAYKTNLAATKISFDYDDTFSTKKGFDKAVSLIEDGADVYIISAREQKTECYPEQKRQEYLRAEFTQQEATKRK